MSVAPSTWEGTPHGPPAAPRQVSASEERTSVPGACPGHSSHTTKPRQGLGAPAREVATAALSRLPWAWREEGLQRRDHQVWPAWLWVNGHHQPPGPLLASHPVLGCSLSSWARAPAPGSPQSCPESGRHGGCWLQAASEAVGTRQAGGPLGQGSQEPSQLLLPQPTWPLPPCQALGVEARPPLRLPG